MFLKFSATNFRSIKEKVSFDLTKTGLKGSNSNVLEYNNIPVLKSAMIYGPNASGKSNLIRAMRALQWLVVNSGRFTPNQVIPPYEPHLLDVDYSNAPVNFEIQFIARGVKYDYELSFNNNEVEKEELYYYPKGSKSKLFSRISHEEIKYGDYKGPKKAISSLLLSNQLFLSKAAQNNVESLIIPYTFFTEGLHILSLVDQHDSDSLESTFQKMLHDDPNSEYSKLVKKLVEVLDTGIKGLDVERLDHDKIRIPDDITGNTKDKLIDRMRYIVTASHPVFKDNSEVGMTSFLLKTESSGTNALINIGSIIINALLSGGVIVIDEIEKNLHPNVTRYLINMFNNPTFNPLNTQLIFSTHDVTQLSNDSFRRDQIWFLEKDEYGSSKLIRCSEIKGIRLDTPLDKWYVNGKFGGTPIIDDLELEMLFEDIHGEN